MTDAIDRRSPGHALASATGGLANPIFVSLSIVTILAAAVLAGLSMFAHDHRAHEWNFRLFGAVVAIVAVLAVIRISVRMIRRVHEARRLDLVPAPIQLDPRTSAGAGRGIRRHRRVVPTVRTTTLETYDGRRIPARVINVSMGGVAIEAPMTPVEFATVIRVGSRAAGPIRRIEKGAVFRFDRLLDPLELDQGLIL